jgi:hypothetical protein
MGDWLTGHWFDVLQTVGITGSFLLAAYATWKDVQARRIGNSIAINGQYRTIWKDIYEHPALARVLEKDADATDISIGDNPEFHVLAVVIY